MKNIFIALLLLNCCTSWAGQLLLNADPEPTKISKSTPKVIDSNEDVMQYFDKLEGSKSSSLPITEPDEEPKETELEAIPPPYARLEPPVPRIMEPDLSSLPEPAPPETAVPTSTTKTRKFVVPDPEPVKVITNGREFVTDQEGNVVYIPAQVKPAMYTDIKQTNYTLILGDFNSDGSRKNKPLISVFSDHRCTYCKKLFAALPQVIKAGYAVQYIFMSTDTRSPFEYQKIYCSKQPTTNLINAYEDLGDMENKFMTLPQKNGCFVNFNYLKDVSDRYKITGAPSIYFENHVLKFSSPEQLVRDLNEIRAAQK